MQQDTSARRESPFVHNTPEEISDNSGISDGAGNSSSMKSRNPKCALCQNHGKVIGTKFHKRYCPWKECTCKKCEFIKYRRKVIAAQIADRRKMIEDRERQSEKKKPVDVEKPREVDDDDNKSPSFGSSQEKHSELKMPKKQKPAESSVAAPAPLVPFRTPVDPTLFHQAPVPVSSSSHSFLGNLPRFPGPHSFLQSSQSSLAAGFQSGPPPLQPNHRMFYLPHQTNYPVYRFWDNFGGDFKLAAAKIFEARYGPRPQVETNLQLYSAQRYAYQQLPLSQPHPPDWSFHNRLL